MEMLNGCIAENGQEIDGQEFRIETLKELIELLEKNKEIHLNYFDDEDNLDLWIERK